MLTKSQIYTKFTYELGTVIEALRSQKMTVGFAESCTGGRLSALWAETSGVSDVFLGSVVSYSNQVKTDLLGVGPELLLKVGAVSAEVAGQMARGLRQSLKVDWAVSITGIAGPKGGTVLKPVGTVWFGVAGPGIEETCQQHFTGERVEIQNAAAEFATRWLGEKLNGISRG
jgi:nicotinamide-nucleotide amidase